ncbi:hypothetical protein DPMN_104599 [Dreissena polymorpha]|uniref:Uncharacterized protein n=2 Tax=Dreissena polymorpha TaxID=45954 RepID=A0A9D4K199_DREPO|nr:hypothetical protein DPMN_104599 [Dreissena polymorpha]
MFTRFVMQIIKLRFSIEPRHAKMGMTFAVWSEAVISAIKSRSVSGLISGYKDNRHTKSYTACLCHMAYFRKTRGQ